MPMHTIEVDDDVFAFLRSRAEPFTDSPNSVLRRTLGIAAATVPGRRPQYPRLQVVASGLGLPVALQHILEVVEEVRRTGKPRVAATLDVARRHRVTRETVADKYGRQLGLSTNGFDMMLGEPGLGALERLLVSKFPEHAAEVRERLAPLRRGPAA